MRRVFSGSLVHCEQTIRGEVAMPGRRTRRVYASTPVHYDQTRSARALPVSGSTSTFSPMAASSWLSAAAWGCKPSISARAASLP